MPDRPTVNFRTDNGHYLCAENEGRDPINATRTVPQAWETFEVERLDDGKFAFVACNGRYVCAEAATSSRHYGRLIADRDAIGAWETFTVIPIGDTRIALQTHNGRFVHARHGGGYDVTYDRLEAFAHEEFEPSAPFFRKPRSEVAGRIRAHGVQFLNASGVFRPCFVSGFTLSADLIRDPTKAIRFVDWAAGTGFNGIRVMVGALSWAGQTPELARSGLDVLLTLTAERGLYVEVVGLTDTRDFWSGIPEDAHVRTVAGICTQHENAIIELANEPWHPTQKITHDWGWLTRLGQTAVGPTGLLWAEGALPEDEADAVGSNLPAVKGSYVTAHLNRGGGRTGRDEWNMVRRVRELETLQHALRRPIMNNEPIGWDEVSDPGRRNANPQIAFAMGALSRAFEVGLVSHAQHGLRAEMPGPVQQSCHEHLLRGFRAIPATHQIRLQYKNAGHVGSPIRGWAQTDQLVRAYSFLDQPSHGWTILVGRRGDPQLQWANGFRPINVIDDVGGAAVLEVAA